MKSKKEEKCVNADFVLTILNAFLGLPLRRQPLALSVCILPLAFVVVESPLELRDYACSVGSSRCPGLLLVMGVASLRVCCILVCVRSCFLRGAHCWFICN